jgi:hypothetical protein
MLSTEDVNNYSMGNSTVLDNGIGFKKDFDERLI